MRTAARALVRRAPWAAPRKRALHRSRAWLDVRPFLLADIGEGIAEVELMQWFVKEGDHVGEFDPICEVQSDKATVEITSRYAGVVSKVHHALGDIVPVGNALIDIDMDGGGAAADAAVTVPDAAPEAAAPVAAGAPAVEELRPAAPPAQADSGKVLTTPAVRRIAKERGLDLALIRGSGPNGRILKGDVLGGDPYTAAAKTMPPPIAPVAPMATPPAPAPAPASAAPATPAAPDLVEVPEGAPTMAYYDKAGKTEPCRGLQRLMVKSMAESLSIPHFGYCDEVNMDELMQVRAALKEAFLGQGVKLSYMPFLIKACSLAMMQQPLINSTLDAAAGTITYHEDHNIGIAMDTPRGLVVPNVKRCQTLSLLDVARELNRLQHLAATGNLGETDLTGTTMSLSNIGSIGGTYTKPVIVPPQVAIGALGSMQRVPRYASPDSDEVIAAHILNVSWSGDHRAIDGGSMARFGNAFKSYVENPASMMMHLR